MTRRMMGGASIVATVIPARRGQARNQKGLRRVEMITIETGRATALLSYADRGMV